MTNYLIAEDIFDALNKVVNFPDYHALYSEALKVKGQQKIFEVNIKIEEIE